MEESKYGGLELLVRDIVYSILEEARSIGDHDTLSDLDYGRKMGLLRALSIIRATLFLEDADPLFGLDFDLDNEIAGFNDVTSFLEND